MTIFPRTTVFRPMAFIALSACVFLSAALTSIAPVMAQGRADTNLSYIESADGTRSSDNFNVIRNTHARLNFKKDISRVAVGDPSILEMDVLDGREILMIAKEIGKTSVIVWYTDNTAEPLMFDVVEDLTVLVGVLRDIDPDIAIEMAPDRAALILRGTVPTIRTKIDAEAAARSYLNSNASQSFEIFTPNTSSAEPDAVTSPIAIINLLKTDEIALSVEQRIIDAIGLLTKGVTIKRAAKGQVADDSVDTFLLEGEVENQVILTRVLSVAASIIGTDSGEIVVVSDEGGGIAGGAISLIGTNIARAKILSIAGGRILSMIRVRNIPQVRIAVKIHEVNRNLLRDWKPTFSATTNNYQAGNLGTTLESSDPALFALRDIDVGNALEVIKGTMTNNLQIATQDVAFDILFGMMEAAGISRSLSNPTITVLSGEEAVFEVGGQVPVPASFTPESSVAVQDGAAQQLVPGQLLQAGTYATVNFKQYGVTLKVFPLVDENNLITLDVRPEISQPDIALTRQITEASGGSSATTAFNTRSLQTRAQVSDGQPMIIGGLISRTNSDLESSPQGIGNFPMIGTLTNYSSRQEQTQELVIIVTPTIVLQPLKNDGLWQYPSMSELLEQAVGIPDRDSLSRPLRTGAMFK